MLYAFHFSKGREESIRLAENMLSMVNSALSAMVKDRFDELLQEFPWDYLRKVLEECTATLELQLEHGVAPYLLPDNRNFSEFARLTEGGDVLVDAASEVDEKIRKLAGEYLGGYDVYFEGREHMLDGVEDSRFDPVIESRLKAVFAECMDKLDSGHTKICSEIDALARQNGFVLPLLGVAEYLFGYSIEFCRIWRDDFVPRHVQAMQQLSDNAAAQAQAAADGAAAEAQNLGAGR